MYAHGVVGEPNYISILTEYWPYSKLECTIWSEKNINISKNNESSKYKLIRLRNGPEKEY